MSKYSRTEVIVPDIDKPFTGYDKPSTKASNIAMVKGIQKNYGASIKRWASVFEIPEGIIIGFIATESGGKQNIVNRAFPNIKGLMQVSDTTIYDVVVKWKVEVDSDRPAEMDASLKAKIPELLGRKMSDKMTPAIGAKIVSLAGADADFNIMMGTAILRWLLERFSTTLGGGQLNKAMVAYNAGPYNRAISTGTKAITTPIDTATLAANPRVPAESRGYLFKMLGKDGFLDLIYKQKALG
jgi:soluble lytic murein transglycosylase-like protein